MENQDHFIPVAEPSIGERELELVTACVKSTWVSSLGEYITQFEDEFARYCGARYGIATSNGTTALHLALAVLGIGPGDEVIVPSLTFIATASAVIYTGATPVFADVEQDTWTLDPEDVQRKITARTRAIIPVHLYGHPADMDEINRLAKQHDLWVIEDAAEAHGAFYRGKRVGSLSDISAFSFYGNKIITTGEGGMLLTDNPEWVERAANLRDHAMSPEKRYWHSVIGFNYRMTNLQAALGVAQMEKIDDFITAKRRNAALYNDLLRNVEGVTLPPEAPWATNVYWMYSVLVDPEFGMSRDDLMAFLKERRIDSRPFFYPLHTLPPFNHNEYLPVSEKLGTQGINLPSAVTLTPGEINRICTAIREAAGAKLKLR
jgi:perosamine synthetase